MSNENAINVLYKMRKGLDARILHHKVVSYFLLGLLIIQFIFFSLIRQVEFFGLMGVFLVFGWLSFSVLSLIKLKEEQNNIDNFYLENMVVNK